MRRFLLTSVYLPHFHYIQLNCVRSISFKSRSHCPDPTTVTSLYTLINRGTVPTKTDRVLGEAALTSTNNSCFGVKIRKIGIPLHTPVFLYESGVKRGIQYMDMFA